MRILFISTETRPMIGGIANCLDSWLSGIAENDLDVCMLGLLPHELIDKVKLLHSRPYREEWCFLEERKPQFLDGLALFRKFNSGIFLIRQSWAVGQKYRKLAKDFQPDWVVFSVLNPVCCIPLSVAYHSGKPCAAIAYGSEINPVRVSNPSWLKRTLKKFNKVVVISEFTRRLVELWGVRSGNIAIVHPGLSPDFVESSSQSRKMKEEILSQKEFHLLTICRLVERKGVQTVIYAVRQLCDQGIPVFYDIVGDGPYRSVLENMAEELDLQNVVKFWGVADDHKREELLADCDIFVMVPFEDQRGDVEGFGIVYLEAGWFGKPVIGSWSGGVADAVKHEETGLLVQPENSKDLFSTIQNLINHLQQQERLGQNGNQWALLHSPKKVGKQFIEVLYIERLAYRAMC